MQKKLIKKVSLLGDMAVGKTSLIARYVHNIFDDKYLSTVGTKISKKVMKIGDDELILMIWDIAGQEVYEGRYSYYSRGTESAFLVFDLTRKDTFRRLENWVDALFSNCGKTPFIVLGNKSDLPNKEVSFNDIDEFVRNYNTEFLYTSAKTGDNVENAFNLMVRKIVKE